MKGARWDQQIVFEYNKKSLNAKVYANKNKYVGVKEPRVRDRKYLPPNVDWNNFVPGWVKRKSRKP